MIAGNMRCIDHTETNCDCKPTSWTLLYRHTPTELDAILDALRDRAECLPRWIERVDAALDSKLEPKVGQWEDFSNDLSYILDEHSIKISISENVSYVVSLFELFDVTKRHFCGESCLPSMLIYYWLGVRRSISFKIE